VKMFDADKTKWLGYREVKTYDNTLSHFHRIPECNGWTDRLTDRIAITDFRNFDFKIFGN